MLFHRGGAVAEKAPSGPDKMTLTQPHATTQEDLINERHGTPTQEADLITPRTLPAPSGPTGSSEATGQGQASGNSTRAMQLESIIDAQKNPHNRTSNWLSEGAIRVGK